MKKDEKQRIAICLATSGHSGVDRVMKNLIRSLSGLGWPVDLLKVRNHGPYFADLPSGVRLVDLGHDHVYACLPALVRYLRRVRPVALLADKDRVNRTVLPARLLSGVPVRLGLRIGTSVSANLKQRNAAERWLQRLSMKYGYRHADVVILPSRSAAVDFQQFSGLRAPKVQAIDSPVWNAHFETRLNAPVDHPWLSGAPIPVILGIGALTPRKDFVTLIKAFARVTTQRPARLIVLGKGPELERLQQLARRLGIERQTDFPGFVENPYPYLRKAAVFALTSRYEGAPVALIEALCAGVTPVATDSVGGSGEILESGRLGDLVPVGDAAALATALLHRLEHPVSRTRLRENARRYQADRCARAYLAALLPENVPH